MTVKELTDIIDNPNRVRIMRGAGNIYEKTDNDLYIGWLGELKHRPEKIEKAVWDARVKKFTVNLDIKHKDWKDRKLFAPLEPEQTPQFRFTDMQMTAYYMIVI